MNRSGLVLMGLLICLLRSHFGFGAVFECCGVWLFAAAGRKSLDLLRFGSCQLTLPTVYTKFLIPFDQHDRRQNGFQALGI